MFTHLHKATAMWHLARRLALAALVFLAPAVSWGQGTLTIGDGTDYASHNSGNIGSPMSDTYYYYSATQSIYTASELGGARTITSVAFYHNAGNLMDATINIYLAHTTASAVDASNPATTGTLVYSGTNITLGSSAAEWQVFDFSSTPFEYNGTDNLLVIVCRTKRTAGSNSAYNSSLGWQFTTTSDNMFMQRYNDDQGYDDITNTSYSYTASTNRPNIQIGYQTTDPYILLAPASATVMTGFTTTLTATYGNVTDPTITYSSSDDAVATVTGTGTNATVTGIAPGTATITATMNGSTTATCAITVEDPSYCEPHFSSPSDDYISNFTTAGGTTNIDNTSTYVSGGYSDYYDSQSAEIEAGETLTCTVEPSSTQWSYGHAIWVDWNNDYQFAEDEKVAYSSSVASGTWTGSFEVPTTIAAGDYHMRVIHAYNGAPTGPCMTNNNYGEAEDYKLTVFAANPCAMPDALTANGEPTAHEYSFTIDGGSGLYNIFTKAGDNDWINWEYEWEETTVNLTGLTPETAYQVRVQSVCNDITDPETGDAATSSWRTLNFTTPVACPAPTNLNISNVAARSADISWTETGEATAWQICLNGDEENLIAAPTNPYTLTGLTPETEYSVKVRAYCNSEDQSHWTNEESFTTDVAFPAPTALAVNNIMARSADISWTGNENATGAVLEYASTEGDPYTEYKYDNGTYLSSIGLGGGAFQWGVMFPAGSYAGTTVSKVSVYDPTAMTGSVTIYNDGTTAPANAVTTVPVTFTGVGDFIDIDIDATIDETKNLWVIFYNESGTDYPAACANDDLGDANGRWVEINGTWYDMANVGVTGECFLIHAEIGSVDISSMTWTPVDNATSPYSLTGLTPETNYMVRVKSLYPEEGESAWAMTGFTTDVACHAPTNLTATPAFNTASIAWEGTAEDGFEVQYRTAEYTETPFFDDFENGLDQWTIYSLEDTYQGLTDGWINSSSSTEVSTPHSGNNCAVAYSYSQSDGAINADNYLVSPQVPLGGTLKFWVYTYANYPDSYEVLLSTTGNAVADFTVTLQEMAAAPANNQWNEIAIDLSSYTGSGYIAIHHVSNDQWILAIDDFGIYGETIPAGEWLTATATANSTELTGLALETSYDFQVKANCGSEDGESAWSAMATFTTLDANAAPVNLQADDVTANAATLSWRGAQESYTVRYRPVYYFTPFNTDEERAGWDFKASIYGFDDPVYNIPGSSNYFLSMGWNASEEDNEDTIISPELPAYPSGSTLEFYHFYYTTENAFQVGYSTTTRDDMNAYTWSDPISSVSGADGLSAKYSQVLPDGVKFVAFRSTATAQSACIFIDNVKIYRGAANSEWEGTVSNVNATTLAITGLDPNTEYEWQVQGNLTEGTTEWSELASFTTLPFTLNIEANKWYAISSPVNTPAVTDVINLVSPTNDTEDPAYFAYDLYRYKEVDATWENYKAHTTDFNFEQGRGYIYRRSADAVINFGGTPYGESGLSYNLSYACPKDHLKGFNLVGNPYLTKASISEICYELRPNGMWLVKENNVLDTAEAVLVHTNAAVALPFTPVAAKNAPTAIEAITFAVSNDEFEDVAYAKLDDGKGLPKVGHLNEAAPALSIPVEGRNYAIAMLGFGCETFDMDFRGQAGEYTLTLKGVDGAVSYLHLIDRVAGKDIDLLGQKSYSFRATGSDASRFLVRLKAAEDETNGTFAYWNGNAWVVNGEGTLQVYDVMGRLLFTQTGNQTIHTSQFPAAGVYVIRMGEKSQKIVVK